MTEVAKIIEIVGSSTQGWEDAVQVAITEAGKTIHGITGLEVIDMTGKVALLPEKLKCIELLSKSRLGYNIHKIPSFFIIEKIYE